MKKFLKTIWKTMKWSFVVFCVFILSLFFREQKVPNSLVAAVVEAFSPDTFFIHTETVSFGFLQGLHIRNLRIYAREVEGSLKPFVSADSVSIFPRQRRVVIGGLNYQRLPASYYEEVYHERNARVNAALPNLGTIHVTLMRPRILGLTPESVTARVNCSPDCLRADGVHLAWPDKDEIMYLDGYCTIDFKEQKVKGEVVGTAKQHHIRPFLEAMDVPSALPYMDAFTDVPCKIPAKCKWEANLMTNAFALDLDLDPTLGKYNDVPMSHATGHLSFRNEQHEGFLDYHNVIGPIHATGAKGEPLDGMVTIEGVNGTNTVCVTASSLLPAAHLLKIGGFTGDYVSEEVFGESKCDLKFVFPQNMRSNSQMNGQGHLEIKNGQVMRLNGFTGLIDQLADTIPGVSWFTDSTQASCDYVIRDGVLSTDNLYIEGAVFSIYMWGTHDMVTGKLDFTARVQFMKKDSLIGTILHPITWPFTKLLLEFRLTGTTDHPEWHYISVLDRVWN